MKAFELLSFWKLKFKIEVFINKKADQKFKKIFFSLDIILKFDLSSMFQSSFSMNWTCDLLDLYIHCPHENLNVLTKDFEICNLKVQAFLNYAYTAYTKQNILNFQQYCDNFKC